MSPFATAFGFALLHFVWQGFLLGALIAGVLAHAYLGTVANPGTWRVLVDGSVTREWARHHHPNWYKALIATGVITPENGSNGKTPPTEDA